MWMVRCRGRWALVDSRRGGGFEGCVRVAIFSVFIPRRQGAGQCFRLGCRCGRVANVLERGWQFESPGS